MTNRKLSLGIVICFFVFGAGQWSRERGAMAAQGKVDFVRDIQPIFAAHCVKCHGPEKQMAQLRLDNRGAAMRVIAAGRSADSRLLHRVLGLNSEARMPKGGEPLPAAQVDLLRRWIDEGAVWPESASVDAARRHWAFVAPVRPALPEVRLAGWVRNPIDRFVLARLEKEGLRPSPEADRVTLLRRLSLDLIGLPPTPEEVDAFLRDASPDAYEKQVDRLLRSPHYGERWGRHWLDVARYADSTGNDEDHRYPFAWKYRDYVIESFNRDLPYSQFVREQLAGDLLPPGPGEKVNRRGIIATGFLALGPKAVAQQDKMKMLYDVYDEQVDVTSKAFLGMTLACARCHNHKFDPLLTRDYYAMTGIFASTRSFTNPDSHVSVVLEKPLVPEEEWARYKAARKEHQEKERRERVAIEEIVDEVRGPLVQRNAPRLAEYMLASRRVYADKAPLAEVARAQNLDEEILRRWVKDLQPEELTPQHLLEWRNAPPEKIAEVAGGYQERFLKRFADWTAKIEKWRAAYRTALADGKASLPDRPTFDAGEDRFFDQVYFNRSGPFGVSEKETARFTPEQAARIEARQKTLDALKKSAPAEPEMACAVEDGAPVAQKVFIRGDYNNRGDEAPKSFPAILADFDTRPAFNGSGRLQLADWLVQPEHPLTARVMANRIWLWHFGEGIVRTPDNFGWMGDRPSHPELLDFLARAFVESGWSMKSMHRMIMLSSTYQMASINPALPADVDGDNRLLSRFHRRRLSVEEMRDGLLAIDGTIDLTMGGTLQAGRGTDGENNQGRLSLNPEKVKRRTVYLPLRRANLPTLLNLFDFGDATTMGGRRQLTNVATQALFWLNSEFLTDRSATVAKTLLAEEIPDAVRVEKAYLRILNRRAEAAEVAAALRYIEGYRQKLPGEKGAQGAWQSFCRVLMASNDFLYLD